MSEQTIWGIHTPRSEAVETLFGQKKTLAIGWSEMGDLSQYKDRHAFKVSYAHLREDLPPLSIAGQAGVMYRFVQQMKVGDLVVNPNKYTREVRIGRVAGNYEYHPEVNARYPNHRKVEWLKTLPRTKFSQAALYEMGSAITLFQVQANSDEILALLEGEEEKDDGTQVVTPAIEQQTYDFVLKRLSRKLKGRPFEDFVASLLQRQWSTF